ncbi:MAG: threonine/serine exporter family protein [Muribaculaceae bacterium]|nr:threonine/serine exporter family protein [Muribaculaceae bacterium]
MRLTELLVAPSATYGEAILDEEARLSVYSEFFATYASYMLGCGATCIRISKNLHRMGGAVNVKVDMMILSHHVTVICTDSTTGLYVQHTKRIAPVPVSFEMNTRLSELSWKIAENTVTMEEAQAMFYRIIKHPPMSVWKVMWLVVAANASFCYLFGGDPGAMLIVAIATLAGYTLKNVTLSRHWDVKVVWLLCSFVSALVAAALTYLPMTNTPEWATAASVLYLIPGIPYINSISDCIDGHYMSSIGRFIHALFLTICIAIGLTAGVLMANGSLVF